MSCYVRNRDPEMVRKLIVEMKNKGLDPDLVIYHYIIKGMLYNSYKFIL